MMRLLLVVLMIVLIGPLAAAERQLEIIPLKHRLLGDVLPVLEPLVEPGGSITGIDNKLIIKASPENIRAIKEVLNSLDKSPRQLLITVRQNNSEQFQRSDQGVSGRYSDGDVTVESGDRFRRDGLRAGIEDEDGNRLQYELDQRSGSSSDRNSYRVRATEGYPAHIMAGELYPFPQRNVYITPGNVVVQDSYQYENATSGFYVLPRLQGDIVTLEIAPRMRRVQRDRGAPVMQLQDVQTVVSGRLGEWIPVGGINESSQRHDNRILDRGERKRTTQASILIRVEAINE